MRESKRSDTFHTPQIGARLQRSIFSASRTPSIRTARSLFANCRVKLSWLHRQSNQQAVSLQTCKPQGKSPARQHGRPRDVYGTKGFPTLLTSTSAPRRNTDAQSSSNTCMQIRLFAIVEPRVKEDGINETRPGGDLYIRFVTMVEGSSQGAAILHNASC